MNYLSLLRIRLSVVSPEAKLVLLRFLQKYGPGRSAGRGVAALAADMGVSGPLVKRGLSELTVEGLLIRIALSAEYECSEALRETLAEDDGSREASPLHLLADHVLNPASEIMSLKSYDRRVSDTGLEPATPAQRKATARKRLGETASGTNRLLLAVLLIHADEFGVVRGLGISDLSALAGLKRARVEMHLFKLNELGVIRFKVAGFSGSRVLGSPKTLYYLNLHHRCFSGFRHDAMVLVLQAKTDSRENLQTHAGRLFLGREGPSGFDFYWPLIDQASAEQVELFDKAIVSVMLESKLAGGGRAELLMLQTIVDGYASSLLSRHWSSLSAKESFTDDDLLKLIQSQIKVPFRRSLPIQVFSGLKPDLFLYKMAFLLACQYRTLLDPAVGAGGEGMKFQILPISDQAGDRGGRSVLALRKDGSVDRRCVVITEGQREIQSFDYEAVMSVAQCLDHGLLNEFHALKRYGRARQSTSSRRL